MRLLAGFSVVCLLLAGLFAWRLAGARTDGPRNTSGDNPPQSRAAAVGTEAFPARGVETGDRAPAGRDGVPEAGSGSLARPTSAPDDSRDQSRGGETGDPHPATTIHGAPPIPQDDSERPSNAHPPQPSTTADPSTIDDPEKLEPLVRRAERDRRWEDVAALLARRVELEPDDLDARFAHAAALLRLRRWYRAATELDVVTQQRPADGQAWFNLAVARQAMGHLHASLAAWNEAERLMPDNADVPIRRAEVLMDLRDWRSASVDLERALEGDPEAQDARLNLAMARLHLREFDAAREVLTPLLDANPQHVPALNRMAEIAMVESLGHASPRELRGEAIGYLERSLAAAPGQPGVRELLRELTGEDPG